ncbi:hypothetical protein ACP70R_044073 [Stipagrostis hirtigluma subsp. patula]
MATAAEEAAPAKGTGAPQLDKLSRRVLYAEARKDAVDFLIGLLRVPAGLAARVLAKHVAVAPGPLGVLYAGAASLDDFLPPRSSDPHCRPPSPAEEAPRRLRQRRGRAGG